MSSGANQFTSRRFISETHKECSWCEEIKPHDSFYVDKRNQAGRYLSYYCKPCACKNSRKNDRARRDSGDLGYIHSKRNTYIKRKFGITLEAYLEKLKAQGSLCAICKVELPTSGYKTHLDHDHKTGQIRAFLCTNCNRGLGHFQDNRGFLKSAITYLDAHNSNVD